MRNNAVNSLGMLGPYVVGTDLGSNYLSIQDAITAASSIATSSAPLNVYIKPGVYVEDLTLAPNVNLIGLGGSLTLNALNLDGNMPVQVQGRHTCAVVTGSHLTFDTIQFTNNDASHPLFNFTGTGGPNVTFIIRNCKINDGNFAQNLFQYDPNLSCITEFFECSIIEQNTGGGVVYASSSGAFSQTLVFNSCILKCNTFAPNIAANFQVTLNSCIFIGNNGDIIDSANGDISNYNFNNCTLSGDIINIDSPAIYTFNNCIWTGFFLTGTASVGASITMVNCQVSGSNPITSAGILPRLDTFPLGTVVLIENCFWTAHIYDSVARRVLVNKRNAFGTASEAFTGMFTYEVQVAQTSVSNTPLNLFVIPMATESSNLINIAITGNIPPASTCSGYIRSAYGLFAAYGVNPLQNFLIDETGGFGPDGAAVSLVPGAGTITIQVVANAALGTNHYWAATITWTNVFTNA